MKNMRLGREKPGSSVGKKAPKPDKLYKQKNKAEKATGLDSAEVARNAPQFVDFKRDHHPAAPSSMQQQQQQVLDSKLLGCGVTHYLHDEENESGLFQDAAYWGIASTISARRSNKVGGDEADHLALLKQVQGRPGLAAVLTGVQYGKPPFGETKPCCDSEFQRQAFVAHCRFAVEHRLPIILSLAPDNKDEREHARAVQDLQAWLEESQVPKDYRLCLSAWAGAVKPLLLLLKLYPNSVVGLNGAVAFRSNEHLREAAFDIPLDRLVLESDAPNTPPSDLLLPHSSWTVLVIAQCVAEQKKLSVDEVLLQCNANAAKFFARELKQPQQQQGDKAEETTEAQEEEDEEASPTAAATDIDLNELAKYLEQ